MTALRKEIDGLVKPDAAGNPGLLEVDLSDERYKTIPRVFTTIVMKIKACGLFKARLVLRGDMVPLASQHFLSAPTASRAMVKIILSLAANLGFTLGTVDVSMAFIQSDVVHPDERLIAIVPDWIPLPWKGRFIGPTDPNPKPRVTRGFLTVRPLYGGRDAPLRWFIKISSVFREKGWVQLRSDVCLFVKRSKANRLVGVFLIHVDDVLCAALPAVWQEFRDIMSVFKTGDFEYVTPATPVTFLGCTLVQHPREGYSLPKWAQYP